MEIIRKRPGTAAAVAFLVGLFIGLVVLGWWLWPVEWTGAGLQDLTTTNQELFVRTVAELYSFDGDTAKVTEALGGWGGDSVACQLAQTSADPAQRARLEAVAAIVNNQGCVGQAAPAAEAAGGGGLGPTLLLLFLLLLLMAAILFVFNRRNALLRETQPGSSRYADAPKAAPLVTQEAEITAVPIARFRTNYARGHDTYDDSFSIENASGDFLGECGVGISEALGPDAPRSVTAFEVWLFDKNDIRTITKVIMSDHAFFDDALKAKLAPKGEPVLARAHETIVLETATLIINAEITEMDYGEATSLPPQSYFERFTIELSAWAKEGDFGDPDVQGRVDELMDY